MTSLAVLAVVQFFHQSGETSIMRPASTVRNMFAVIWFVAGLAFWVYIFMTILGIGY